MLLNVFFVMYYTFAMVILCLIWGPDAKNYFFPRFMTESSQREILNNSILKILHKHESLIFFLLEEKQDHTVSQIYCNALELNACLFEVLSE